MFITKCNGPNSLGLFWGLICTAEINQTNKQTEKYKLTKREELKPRAWLSNSYELGTAYLTQFHIQTTQKKRRMLQRCNRKPVVDNDMEGKMSSQHQPQTVFPLRWWPLLWIWHSRYTGYIHIKSFSLPLYH